MSIVHVRHVKNTLNRLFDGNIDLRDAENMGVEQKESLFLSRALAAYSLYFLAEIDEIEAAKCVVDGYNDNGLDAIYIDKNSTTLWLINSKWVHSGKGCPELGEIMKFSKGIRDLISYKYDRFNEKINKLIPEIQNAIDDINIHIKIILPYTGGDLSTPQSREINDLLEELNGPSTGVASFTILNLRELHRAVSGMAKEDEINFEIVLNQWGQIDEPYRSFYGVVNCVDIANLWCTYGQRLFIKNIRKFLGDTTVNESIKETIIDHPGNFYYFNNGINILCKSVTKKIAGGADRTYGIFNCEGAHVVNGAQTVGSIGNVYLINEEAVKNSKIFIRIISLEKCPEGYDAEITRANNTQNKIEKRDFVSLDPIQEKLKLEFYLEGRTYSYKSGDEAISKDDGCDTQGCNYSISLLFG